MKKLDKKSKKKLSFYFVLRIAIFVILVEQVRLQNFQNVFLCVLSLGTFFLPAIVERKLDIELPDVLEAVIVLFVFATLILGEIEEYYVKFKYWDTILHTLNGFLMAAIGFSLVNILNKSERIHLTMSPGFVAFTAFCFSMTVGVMWEFLEFFMDMVTQSDMQKDTWFPLISSVSLHPEGANSAVALQVKSLTVEGVAEIDGVMTPYSQTFESYLDLGIYDTMIDMIVNFVGASVFCILGYLYKIGKGKGKIFRNLVPRFKKKNKINTP